MKSPKICKCCKYGSNSSDEKSFLSDYEYVYDECDIVGWDLVANIKGIEYADKYKVYFETNEFLVSCLIEDWSLGRSLEISDGCVMKLEYEVLA